MPKRLLILTSHDFLRFSNTRIRHLARHLSRDFEETVVVFRRHEVEGKGFLGRLRAFLGFKKRVFFRDGLKVIELDPWGARPYGLATRLLGLSNPFEERPEGAARLLQEALSAAGGLSDLLAVPSLLRGLSGLGRFRLVITQGPFEGVVGVILKRLGRADFLVCDDADYEPGFAPTRLRQALIRSAERWGMRRADLVVSVGRLLAERRRKEYGLKRVLVVPNGVAYTVFSRAQKKVPGAERNLLYMGYLGGWSGLDLLLAALKHLRARGRPLPGLLLAGHADPLYFSAWKERARRAGIPFRYLGRFAYEELVVPLSQATVGWAVFPPIELRRFAFPLKVVEYMAGGLAVLATEGTEAGLLVKEHGAGLSLPYRKEAVAEALLEVFGDQEKLQAMVKMGAKTVLAYDWALLLERYRVLLKNLGV